LLSHFAAQDKAAFAGGLSPKSKRGVQRNRAGILWVSKFWQLGDVRRNPSRLIFREHFHLAIMRALVAENDNLLA